jgi:hypothetical protein
MIKLASLSHVKSNGLIILGYDVSHIIKTLLGLLIHD